MNAEFEALLRRYLAYADGLPLTGQTRLRELGLDSMRAIELLFALEESYGVVFPDERLTDATFETGQALWDTIQQLRAGTGDRSRA